MGIAVAVLIYIIGLISWTIGCVVRMDDRQKMTIRNKKEVAHKAVFWPYYVIRDVIILILHRTY